MTQTFHVAKYIYQTLKCIFHTTIYIFQSWKQVSILTFSCKTRIIQQPKARYQFDRRVVLFRSLSAFLPSANYFHLSLIETDYAFGKDSIVKKNDMGCTHIRVQPISFVYNYEEISSSSYGQLTSRDPGKNHRESQPR